MSGKIIEHVESITISVTQFGLIQISNSGNSIMVEPADAEKFCKFIMECKAEAEKKVKV